MASKLQEEIKQGKPFSDVRQETWLNLQRTSAQLTHHFEHRLRPYGLSPTQYNVLRILRGAGDSGLCQNEIGSRLVAQVPDVPRILARMEKAGWVRRVRGDEDRRMMLVSLTQAGATLVNSMDGAVNDMMAGVFGTMAEADLERLNDLLVQARAHTHC
jgi:DNA-binding MarR family transcriptional regulator